MHDQKTRTALDRYSLYCLLLADQDFLEVCRHRTSDLRPRSGLKSSHHIRWESNTALKHMSTQAAKTQTKEQIAARPKPPRMGAKTM